MEARSSSPKSVLVEMDKGVCADAQKMREVVAAKAKPQGGRFSVFRRQKFVLWTVAKSFGRANIP